MLLQSVRNLHINPYDILKRALILRYTLSEDAQLDKLHKIQLGEMSPIEFLAKLRGSLVSFDHNEPTCKRVIKKVFFEGMPIMVRQLLSATGETDVDLLAQKANDILSVSPANPSTDDKPQYKVNEYFDKQLGNMSDAVDELNRKLEKFTSDQRNKSSAPTSTFLRMNYVFTTTVMAIELINAYPLVLCMQMTQCLILKRIV